MRLLTQYVSSLNWVLKYLTRLCRYPHAILLAILDIGQVVNTTVTQVKKYEECAI